MDISYTSKKNELRDRFKPLRQSLPAVARNDASGKIAERLFAEKILDNAQTIHIYLAKEIEVQTEQIWRRARLLNKRVVATATPNKPAQTGAANEHPPLAAAKRQQPLREIVLSDCSDDDLFIEGPFGIRMPSHIKRVDPFEIDLWIVPGVAFDTQGNRLGFGGGVFDRLMAGTKGIKVGLAFDFQVVDELPTDDTDQPVDIIITEKRTIRCLLQGAPTGRP